MDKCVVAERCLVSLFCVLGGLVLTVASLFVLSIFGIVGGSLVMRWVFVMLTVNLVLILNGGLVIAWRGG